MTTVRVRLPTLHPDQVKAFRLREDARATDPTVSEAERALWAKNSGGRFKAIRCGRRWGKSVFGSTWLADGAIKGEPCGLFAPDYKKIAEIYQELYDILEPVRSSSNKTEGVLRTTTGGRIDFWTLENESAGRSRKYRRVFIDESAFTKPNMMDIWKRSIKPTLLDYSGRAMTASNTNGIDPANFLYQVCNDPQHGFIEYHAPSFNNPMIPERLPGESEEDHARRRLEAFEELRATEHPLVFQQEYKADFVNWSGSAFFDITKWLVDGQPVPMPVHCDAVFAVIDTATKTGSANDGTGVVYCARNRHSGIPLVILGYGLVQIEGALLETWLPQVLDNLEAYARQCGARGGSLGVFIEDKASGEILLQQARRRGLPATPIESGLTALGKDERAISVSGYHHRGEIKITQAAWDETFPFKGTTRNHLVSQVAGFRVGDKDAAKRADDLLDAYCYAVALSLGDADGY